MFERQEMQGNRIILHFMHAEGGLMAATKEGLAAPKETSDGGLSHFEVANASGDWQPATAKIEGQTVIVSSTEVKSPIAVRYAYAVSPQNCNLYSRAGLPAAPFCSKPDLVKYGPKIPK